MSKKNEAAFPVAIYEGTLMLGNIKIPCCVLDDGRRMITKEGLENFMAAMNIATEDELNKFALDFIRFDIGA